MIVQVTGGPHFSLAPRTSRPVPGERKMVDVWAPYGVPRHPPSPDGGGEAGSLGYANRGAAENDRLVDAQHVAGDGRPVVGGHRFQGSHGKLRAAGRVV